MACSVRSSSCSGPDDATAPAIAKFVRGVLGVVVIVGSALSGQGVEAADNSVLKRFLSGIGQDAVGIVDASEDTEIAGPQAIYAGEGDEVYLLDQVNGRVLGFNPKKNDGATRSFRLPTELQPTDLIVRRGQIMVWDGDIHVLRPTGAEDAPTRGLEIISTRAVDDPFTVSEFAQMGSQKPEADGDPNQTTRSLTSRTPPQGPTRQYINSRVHGQIVATVSLDKGGAGALIELEPRGQAGKLPKLQVKVRDRLGALEVLEVDRQGRIFVLGENVPMSGDLPSAFVARYSATGALEGVFDLPLSQSVTLSRRFVTVSETGDVYFLRTQRASVDVLGVGFRPLRTKIIDGRTPPASDGAGRPRKGKGPIAAVVPLTRQRVVDTAFAFEGIRWTLSPSAYGRDPDTACTGFNRVRRPGYLHGKLGQEVRGIPYCWGCHGALHQIRAKIQAGMMAGNVCTRNAPRRDVIGVDCSAFVSATWGLATHFTTMAIPSISRRVENPWHLLPGDAFNKPGSHVMLFLRFTPDRKAEVIEASPGACNGRVCRNVYPLASVLARGYAPVRFRGLANETVANVSFPEEQQKKASKASKGHSKAQKRRRR
jgi:hypothetical protein